MSRRLWLTIGCAVLLFGLGNTAPAAADDISSDDFIRLVEKARNDQAAQEQLDTITAIDGESADLRRLLDTDPDNQQTRLETLRQLFNGIDVARDGAALRAEAEDITSHPPFTGAVASQGGILARIGDFISRLLSGSAAQGVALIALVVFVFAAAFFLMERGTSRRRKRTTRTVEADPDLRIDYRGEAEEAAAAGEFAAAVRLLFIDGTSRLEEQQMVDNAATTSTATVRPLTDESEFLDRFDAIAYGGADAADTDVAAARGSWDRLMNRLRTR